MGDDAVGLEVGRVGGAEREDAAIGRVADQERVGARRADGLEAPLQALEVLGVGGLDIDLDQVALGGPVEEVADGGAGVGLHAAHEALVAVVLEDGEGDGEADEGDAEKGVDAAAGRRAVGGLLAVVVGEDAATVRPRPEDADALDGPRVEEGVGDVADDDGGVEVGQGPTGEPGPEEGEGEDGDGALGGVAVRDRPVAKAALDAPGDGREHAADRRAERVDVGGDSGRRGDHDAGGRPGDLEERGGDGVAEDASGDVRAESHGERWGLRAPVR